MSKRFLLHHSAEVPASLKALGAPKFTADQQAANPDKRMTRVVKDFLRVGKWTCGDGEGGQVDWDVTAGTLTLAAKQFAELKKNGVKAKLYRGNYRNDANGQHDIATQDEIGEIDQVVVDGDRAYFAAYVTPDAAKELANSDYEVSPAFADNWSDSQKRKYQLALLHVAIVDHPVILDQGKFLTLANEGGASHEEASNMKLLAHLKQKYQLADDVTEENIAEAIEEKLAAQSSDGDTVAGGDGEDTTTGGDSKELSALKQTVKVLATEVAELRAAKTNSAKQAYDDKLKQLFKDEHIDRKTLDHYAGLGKSVGFNLAVLAGFDSVKILANNGSRTKELASGNAPGVGNTTVRTDEEVAADLEKRGLKMPKMIRA